MASNSFIFRVEEVYIRFQRAASNFNDTDVLTIFVKVDDGAVQAFTYFLGGQLKTGDSLQLGQSARTLPIECPPNSIISVTYVISNINNNSSDDITQQISKYGQVVAKALEYIGNVSGEAVISGLGQAIDRAASVLGFLGGGAPDCSGRCYTGGDIYTGARLAELTAGWTTHRPAMKRTEPITSPSDCGAAPVTDIVIAVERVAPTLACAPAYGLAAGASVFAGTGDWLEIFLTPPNAAPMWRRFNIHNPPGDGVWTSLGGKVIGTPCLSPPRSGHNVFADEVIALMPDGTIQNLKRDADGNITQGWQPFGGAALGDVKWVPGSTGDDLLVVGMNHGLWQRTRPINGQWGEWFEVPAGGSVGQIEVWSDSSGFSSEGEVYVVGSTMPSFSVDEFFSRNTSRKVLIAHWTNSGWVQGTSNPPPFRLRADEYAVGDFGNTTDLVVVGEDQQVYSTKPVRQAGGGANQGPGIWGNLGLIGGALLGAPALASFVWTYTVPVLAGPPGPSTTTPEVLVVGIGLDRQVYYTYWNGDWDFNTWVSLGGQAIGRPVIAAFPSANKFYVFVVGTDENVYWKWMEKSTSDRDASAWRPGLKFWDQLVSQAPSPPPPPPQTWPGAGFLQMPAKGAVQLAQEMGLTVSVTGYSTSLNFPPAVTVNTPTGPVVEWMKVIALVPPQDINKVFTRGDAITFFIMPE